MWRFGVARTTCTCAVNDAIAGRKGSIEWRVGSCEWGGIRNEFEKPDAPVFEFVEVLGHLASSEQADSAWVVSTRLLVLAFLAWAHFGAQRVAGVAATVVAVACAFGIVAAFAAGAVARAVVV